MEFSLFFGAVTLQWNNWGQRFWENNKLGVVRPPSVRHMPRPYSGHLIGGAGHSLAFGLKMTTDKLAGTPICDYYSPHFIPTTRRTTYIWRGHYTEFRMNYYFILPSCTAEDPGRALLRASSAAGVPYVAPLLSCPSDRPSPMTVLSVKVPTSFLDLKFARAPLSLAYPNLCHATLYVNERRIAASAMIGATLEHG